jgi:archaellum component FlaC
MLVERVVLRRKQSGTFEHLGCKLFYVTLSDGKSGFPRCSLPEELEKRYLSKGEEAVDKATEKMILSNMDLDPFPSTNRHSVALWPCKPTRTNGFDVVHFDEFIQSVELGRLFKAAVLSTNSNEIRRASYGKLVDIFLVTGDLSLVLFCRELECGIIPLDSRMEKFVWLEIARFCGIVCQDALVIVRDALEFLSLGCIGEDVEECIAAKQFDRAVLLHELAANTGDVVGKAKKKFIEVLCENSTCTRLTWKNPTGDLEAALKEIRKKRRAAVEVTAMAASAVATAEVPKRRGREDNDDDDDEREEQGNGVLQLMMERGYVQGDDMEKILRIDRDFLERLLTHWTREKVESMFNKRGKRQEDAAYWLDSLHPGEVMEAGDVICLVYDSDELKCTKQKPSVAEAIFGRSVVAGAAGLEPYVVTDPYEASESSSAVRVVYLGHAFVKIIKPLVCFGVKLGSLLCGSGNGYAIVSQQEQANCGGPLGKVIGNPIQLGNEWFVPAIIFVGRGENDVQLANLQGHFKDFKVQMGGVQVMVEDIKEDQMWIQEATDKLEKKVKMLQQNVEEFRQFVSEVDLRQETQEVRVSQLEESVSNLTGDESIHVLKQQLSELVTAVYEKQKDAGVELGGDLDAGNGDFVLEDTGKNSVNIVEDITAASGVKIRNLDDDGSASSLVAKRFEASGLVDATVRTGGNRTLLQGVKAKNVFIVTGSGPRKVEKK